MGACRIAVDAVNYEHAKRDGLLTLPKNDELDRSTVVMSDKNAPAAIEVPGVEFIFQAPNDCDGLGIAAPTSNPSRSFPGANS